MPPNSSMPPVEVDTSLEVESTGVSPLESMAALRSLIDGRGRGHEGGFVDDLRGFDERLGLVEEQVAGGDILFAQHTLETTLRPPRLDDETRDALLELHRAETGEPTSEQKHYANNRVLADVSIAINSLVRPENPNRVHFTDPEVQKLKSVEFAFKERHRNYFEDVQPENEVYENGEERTEHEVAEDAYANLLGYIEGKIAAGELPEDKVEIYRIARDNMHAERQTWKQHYDAQNVAIEQIMDVVGENNEQFSFDRVYESVRDCVGDKLYRLQEVIDVAATSGDAYETFNLLNSIQQGRAPINSAEEFDAWKEGRAKGAQAKEEQESQQVADEARGAIDGIHGGDVAEHVAPEAESDTSQFVERSFENEIAPLPQDWTFLVHGTPGEKWDSNLDVVTVGQAEGGLSGLYTVTAEQSEYERSRGDDTTAKFAGDSDPVEVRVAFPSDEILRRRQRAEGTGLDDNQLWLMRRVYNQPGYSHLPERQRLLKIGEGEGFDGRRADYYVPEKMADLYKEKVMQKFGSEINLPITEQEPSAPTPSAAKIVELSVEQPSQAEDTTAEALESAPKDVNRQFIESAIKRIPQNVLLESVDAAAQANADRLGIEANVLSQNMIKRISNGELNADATVNELLAQRIAQNGFHESAGGIWQITPDNNSIQGRIAQEARQLVYEVVSQAL